MRFQRQDGEEEGRGDKGEVWAEDERVRVRGAERAEVRMAIHAIFRRSGENESVYVGSGVDRREAEEKLLAMSEWFEGQYYAVDLESGETVERPAREVSELG